MIILTNSLTRRDDEGSLKAAVNLIARMKKRLPGLRVITYENESPMGDRHLQLNKLLLSRKLMRLLRNEDVFFAPLYTRMLPLAVRTLILTLYARRKIKVLLFMCPRHNRLALLLLRLSRAEFVVLSCKTRDELGAVVGNDVHHIRAAVDTDRFVPVAVDKKKQLRIKYGLPVDKPIVLHVGHMKYGRNVDKLLSIDEKFHVLLAVSTTTAAFKDADLEEKLRKKSNITIIDTYVPAIEELYQLADVYLFPVIAERHCIDVPLSAFEAASCNVPVLTTPYGELREMTGKAGFYPIESFEPADLNAAVANAVQNTADVRKSVLDYDWNAAADGLLNHLLGK